MKNTATTVMERCDLLGNVSEEPGALTRPYGSEAMREVNEVVSRWMGEAGMAVRQDEIGNLIGRYEGTGGKTLVLGSHLDTVRDAGKYDGILGVMVATPAVPADPELSALLGDAVEVAGMAVHRLPSGAGHDAAQVTALAPVSMLFVRCKEGISHNPAESVAREDVGAAIEVMRNLLSLLSRKMDTGTTGPDRAHPQERREKG